MTEADVLREKWKGVYRITWCDLCDTATITCPECDNGSCNGSSCDKCHADFVEFNQLKTKVHYYLKDDESKVWEKALRIKKHILETLGRGEREIDWNKLSIEGHLSRWEEGMFL